MRPSRPVPALLLAILILVIATPSPATPLIGSPNPFSGDYRETTEDLRVKVQGGHVRIDREWYAGSWSINRRWSSLRIIYDPADNSIKAIERNDDEFLPTANNPDLFRFGKRRLIERTATGFRWSDKGGEWIEYDSAGRLLRYGDRNAGHVSLSYDQAGQTNGVLDHRDTQILWYEYDAQDRLRAIRDYSGRRVEYGYNAAGLIETVVDTRGNTWQYGYTGGLLTGKTDPEGRTVTLSYDGRKRVKRIEDDLGLWRTYIYDHDKSRREFLFRTIDSTGMQTDSWHDEEGALKRLEINGETVREFATDGNWRIERDFAGLETRLRYDDQQNLVETVFPDGSRITHDYDPRLAVLTRTTDERGIVTRFEHNQRGNRILMIEAAGTLDERTTEYGYDAYGNLLTERRLGDAETAEAITVHSYDEWGNRETITRPEGQLISFEHDAAGNRTARTDARGKRWTFSYDPANLPTAETNPLGHTRTYSYDKVGNLTSVEDRNGHTTTHAYDVRNNRITTTDPLGYTKTTDYDGEGRPIRETDAAGHSTAIGYDPFGRLDLILDPAGDRTELTYAEADDGAPFNAAIRVANPGYTDAYRYSRRGQRVRITKTLADGEALVTTKGYDRSGNQVRETDPENRTMIGTYDALGRVVRITYPDDLALTYHYDNRDNLIRIHNKRGDPIRSYEYDRNDWLTLETWPGGNRAILHDATGNVTETTDAEGRVTRYDYDDAGRELTVRYYRDASAPSPTRSTGSSYDAVGNRIGYSAGTLSATLTYDANNRKRTEDVDFGPFQSGYAYDYGPDGQKTSLTYPDGQQVAFSYDDAGRLATIALPGTGDIRYSGFDRQHPTIVQYPGGTQRLIRYDDLGRIAGVEARNLAATVLMSHSYSYDSVGNLLNRETEHGRYSFSYDALDQLTSADKPTLPDVTFTYDPDGNRLTGPTPGPWTYGEADELKSDGERDFSYDANGNLIRITDATGTVATYDYNGSDRLIAARDGAGDLLGIYAYDPLGRRIRAETDRITYYLYSDEGLIAELDETGTITRRHGWRPDGEWGTDPVWSANAAGTAFPLNDQLGTPWKQINADGAVQWEARYHPFGAAEVLIGDVMDQPFRLPGQYLVPELGTHYNYRRHYDPAAGRYQRFDPLGVRASLNTYLYAANNPLMRTDPYGLCTDGVGASVNACAGFTFGVGGDFCAETKCCTTKCGPECCTYFQVKVCVGLGGGISASANAVAGSCSVGVTFPPGVSACCGPCCVTASETDLGATCCYTQEAGKSCT